jgi:hypothetical protein
MSSGLTFWKRVGNAFRAEQAAPRNGNGGKHTIASVEHESPTAAAGASVFPWVRRRQEIRQIDERYQRVLELMDALRAHFEAQDRRAAELTAGIDRVGGTLERLADVQRGQAEGLTRLAERVDVAAKYGGDLAALMVEMPASVQAQAEAMRAVARQMEATRSADGQLTDSLRQFSRATDSLHESGRAQVEALQRLDSTSKFQEENLRGYVHSQTRLLFVITVIVAVLGLGLIAALAVVVHTVFNGGAPKLG